MSNQKNGFTEEELKMMEKMDRLIAEMKKHPEVLEKKVPESLHTELFRDIREYEAEKAESKETESDAVGFKTVETESTELEDAVEVPRLSDEERELIQLGKIYKRKKKNKKFYVLIAAVICAMAFGVTSMGGPEKVFERFNWMLAGREQTNIDSDIDNIKKMENVAEEEIYQQIEDEYGFSAVRLDYLPEGVTFIEAVGYEDMQGIQLIYGKENEVGLVYLIRPNYRESSVGKDMEDKLLDEYVLEIKDLPINIKRYTYENANEERWTAEFVYKDVQYFITGVDFSQVEFEQILKNLYFF